MMKPKQRRATAVLSRLFGFLICILTIAIATRSYAQMDAPEIARPGLEWFNVAKPLPIASLRGRIVILDFWTEGCINCIQIIPTLRRVEERWFGFRIEEFVLKVPRNRSSDPLVRIS
jgi:thiol-disulfide isomerase/thioredoxin